MTDPSAQAYTLAWAMFVRRCEADDAAPDAMVEHWHDDDIRAFWIGEAQYAIDHLDGAR